MTAVEKAYKLLRIGPFKRVNTWRFHINGKLREIRIWTEALTADWEGTYWKNKKKVLDDLRIKTAELNMLYDALDEITGKKNERVML
jgi:hypothetical protein